MPSVTAPTPSAVPSASRLKTARWATGGFFLVNGALYANLLPRLPEVKDAFALSDVQFGFLVIALPVGSILAGMAPAPLLRRFGSARVAGIGSAALAAVIALAGTAAAWAAGSTVFTGSGAQPPEGAGATLGLGLVVAYLTVMVLAGMLDAIVDTAQNAQGIQIQKAMGRSILNSLHALWSLGAMLGGLMGSAAVATDLPLHIHLAISGVMFAAVALASQRFALNQQEVADLTRIRVAPEQPEPGTPATPLATPAAPAAAENPGAPATTENATAPAAADVQDSQTRSPSTGRALAVVLLISSIAIAGATVEDLGMNWSTLYLARVLDTPAAWAGMGLVALMAAQFIGRLVGDSMTNRFGRVWMTRCGGTLAAAGLAVVALSPAPAFAVAGFAVAGFGCATLVPSAFHAADSVPGLKPGTGLTMAGWLLRAAFLSVSPFVGVVSETVGLRAAVLAVPLVAIFAVVAAGVLKDRENDSATA